jgi:hypothetical protein
MVRLVGLENVKELDHEIPKNMRTLGPFSRNISLLPMFEDYVLVDGK